MTFAWIASLLLVFIAFVVACISAAAMSQSAGGAGKAAGFAAVWTALLLIIISIIGSFTLNRYKKALSIGLFLGIVFIMTQQMLILFALFVERSQLSGNTSSITQSQQAMATFAFFLFLVYGAFGSMLAVFRHEIIELENQPDAGADTTPDDGMRKDDDNDQMTTEPADNAL